MGDINHEQALPIEDNFPAFFDRWLKQSDQHRASIFTLNVFVDANCMLKVNE